MKTNHPRGPKPNKNKRAKIIQLKLKGLSYEEIGKRLKISRQRVQQLAKPPLAIWQLVRKKANCRCEDCGIRIPRGHVHHKDWEADNYNAISNLVYLCAACHSIRTYQEFH